MFLLHWFVRVLLFRARCYSWIESWTHTSPDETEKKVWRWNIHYVEVETTFKFVRYIFIPIFVNSNFKCRLVWEKNPTTLSSASIILPKFYNTDGGRCFGKLSYYRVYNDQSYEAERKCKIFYSNIRKNVKGTSTAVDSTKCEFIIKIWILFRVFRSSCSNEFY